MFLLNPKLFFRIFQSSIYYRIRTSKLQVFLTFDDGPHPQSTPVLLDLLAKYNIKATFFCIGRNIILYPEIFKLILDAGHIVGNHTFDHLDGWRVPTLKYLENINKASDLISSILFRPPYGHITPKQMKIISKSYKVILWDNMPGDFRSKITEELYRKRILYSLKMPGSIIVIHDSPISIKLHEKVLPSVFERYFEHGFEFLPIKEEFLIK